MSLSREDEVKRSREWRIVMLISSALIIVIAGFFLVKMFRSNPLEGTWFSEDTDIILEIRGKEAINASIPEISEGVDATFEMTYKLDKEAKTIAIWMEEAQMQQAVETFQGQLTREDLETAVEAVTATVNYSVDQEELTLTEREYGEQMVFVKE